MIRNVIVEKDFEDLRIGWELDDAKPSIEPIEVTNDEEQITTMEMELVSDIHQSLFISLTNSNWHPMSTGGLRVDPVAPLLVSYQISLELLKSTSDQLGEFISALDKLFSIKRRKCH